MNYRVEQIESVDFCSSSGPFKITRFDLVVQISPNMEYRYPVETYHDGPHGIDYDYTKREALAECSKKVMGHNG